MAEEIITEREFMRAIAAHVPEGYYGDGDEETFWFSVDAGEAEIFLRVTYRLKEVWREDASDEWSFMIVSAYAEVYDEAGENIRITPPEVVADYQDSKFHNVIYD